MTSPQTEFDFLMPSGTERLLKVERVCSALSRQRGHIYDLIDQGRLEAHVVPDREKSQKRVTRDSLAVYLMETATYKPKDLLPRIKALLRRFTTQEELTELNRAIAERRTEL